MKHSDGRTPAAEVCHRCPHRNEGGARGPQEGPPDGEGEEEEGRGGEGRGGEGRVLTMQGLSS